MEPSLDPLAVLRLLGAAQALLLAFVLVTVRRGNRTANRLLAGIAAIVAIGVTATVLSTAHYFWIYPHLSRLNHPFDFLGAPFLFLYVKSLISRNPRLGRKALLHFVPAVLCLLWLTPYYLQSGGTKVANMNGAGDVQWYYLRSVLVLGQFLIYFALIIWTLVKYAKRVRGQVSPAEKAAVFQVRFLVISFLSLWVLGILRYLIDLRYPSYMPQTNLILPVAVTFIIYAMTYLSLRRPEGVMGTEERAPEKKYEKSTLTPERSERYLRRLQQAMEPDKAYTDGDLTIQKLAAKLSIPVQHLSQVVNEQLNQNILDFINTHRVEEAKRRLLDPASKHLSVLAIAEDVGFNSKSAFNAVFKKHTKTTPSEFRKAGNGTGH